MKPPVDSRKLTISVAFIIIISFTLLCYIYSLSRGNAKLTQRYKALVIHHHSCQRLFGVCDNDRKTLANTGVRLQESETFSRRALESKKRELADLNNQLETKKSVITRKEKALVTQSQKLAVAESILKEISSKLSVLTRGNVMEITAIVPFNVSTSKSLAGGKETLLIEKTINEEIALLKKSCLEHLRLKDTYGALLKNHSKLMSRVTIKDGIEQLKSSPGTTEMQAVANITEKQSSVANMENPASVDTIDGEVRGTVTEKQASMKTSSYSPLEKLL